MMNIHNFQLNNVFHENAKGYITRPVIAAKYQPGMENGFIVYFANKATKERSIMTYEGVKFFPTEAEAWNYINADHKQYVKENGKLVEVTVEYDPPMPVLYRKDNNTINEDGMRFSYSDAFVSDESGDYEFYLLERGCWIIQDMDGTIRVWYSDAEETFFGNYKDIVFEVAGKGDYKKVAV